MYEIISALKRSPIVRSIDVLELIDEDSVQLIKIKAVIKKNCLLYITRLLQIENGKHLLYDVGPDPRESVQ